MHFTQVWLIHLLKAREHLEDHGEHNLVRFVSFLELVFTSNKVWNQVSQILSQRNDRKVPRLDQHFVVEVSHFYLAEFFLRPHCKHYFLHEFNLGLISFNLLFFAIHKNRHVPKDAHCVSLLARILVIELKLLSNHLLQGVVIKEYWAVLHNGLKELLLLSFNLLWLPLFLSIFLYNHGEVKNLGVIYCLRLDLLLHLLENFILIPPKQLINCRREHKLVLLVFREFYIKRIRYYVWEVT